jgi:hypothetical protein
VNLRDEFEAYCLRVLAEASPRPALLAEITASLTERELKAWRAEIAAAPSQKQRKV